MNRNRKILSSHPEKKSVSFFDKVYKIVKLIPKGRITSYGAIARYLGSSGSSRMVGWAMNSSHHSKHPVPAHRVMNRNGLLTGKHHFGGPDVMQQLLESEGIEVENDKVVNFEKLFWEPEKELKTKKSTRYKVQSTRRKHKQNR